MTWGSHVCVFYATKEDLLDTAVTDFTAGLGSDEQCVWAVSEPITEIDAKTALRQAIPDIDKQLSNGRMELLQGRDWYLQGDEFNLKKITSGWSKKLSAALAQWLRGHEGQRQRVLDRKQASEEVLRLRTRAGSVSSRSKHDRLVHLLPCGKAEPWTSSMWHAHTNAA
jgi:hypothetical protein